MCIALFLPDYNQSGISLQICIKVSIVKFHGTSNSANRVDTCRLSVGWI